VTWTRGQRWKNDAIYGAVVAALKLGLALPRAWLPYAGSLLGWAAHLLLPEPRRRTLANLALIHPDAAPAARRALARDVYRSLGRNLTDTVALLDPAESPERTLVLPRASHDALMAALGQGRGVVYVTCHLGPWERMAALLAHQGFPITTVARESYDLRFHPLLYERLRTARNIEVIYRGSPAAPLAIVRALRRGRVLGFLVDLPGRVPTREVRWLGYPARIAAGPARIALRTRSPIVVGTPASRGGGDGRLCVHIAPLEADDLPAGEEGEAVLSQRIADALSERIRSLPAHWPWMHPSFVNGLTPRAGPDAGHSPADFGLVH
jgi:Kdo2-lipid IVA lauroyltransferase/acyltransferase